MTADNDELPSHDQILDYLRTSDIWLLYERDSQPTQAVRRKGPCPTVIDGVEGLTRLELLTQMAQRMTSMTVDKLIEAIYEM